MKVAALLLTVVGLAIADIGDVEESTLQNDAGVEVVEDDRSPNWLPFDNMNSALKGYNIMEGNPVSDGKDPGFRQQIFVPTMKNAQHRYVLHPAYTYDKEIYCDTSMTTKVSTTSSDYRKAMLETSKSGFDLQVGTDTEVTLGVDIKAAKISAKKTIPKPFERAWGKSKDFEKIESMFSSKNAVVATASAKCQLYEVTIHTFSSIPPLLEPFKNSIKELNRVNNADHWAKEGAFRNFIKAYGTHFSRKTIFGGEIIHRSVFSGSVKKSVNQDKIKNCEYVRGSKVFGIQVEQDKSGCTSEDEKRLYNTAGSTVEVTTMSKGAAPDSNIYNWAKQQFKAVPLRYELVPIVNLFKGKFLDQQLHVSAENIRKWFVPMYFDFCVSMYGKECTEKIGCGYDDNCPADTECISGRQKNYCTEWSSWSCPSCSVTGTRTRHCDGCSGKTRDSKSGVCQPAASCFPDKVLTYQMTYWGDWHNWQYCPGNSYAVKLQTRIEDYHDDQDDTAMNAISLRCNDGSQTTITSGQSGWGGWKTESHKCEGGFYGGMARIERYEEDQDDTATNAIRLKCRDSQWYKSGESGWGTWTQATYCPAGYRIIGIQTQIERGQGRGDDTALNGVKFKCRYFSN